MSAGSEFEQAPPSPPIQKAGVLGAGTMGARIAAHLANAGLAVVLFDIPSDGTARSAVAARGLDSLRKAKPAAFYDPAFATRITTGNFADDLTLLSDCDWVIEAVTEDLAIKRSLLEKVAPHLKPGAIFSTNTSGLPVAQIGAVLPEGLRARWLGTHFFNPPRYMRLLELIATPETAAPVRRTVTEFADVRLGKEVVAARDTPNFIANRLGVFLMLETVRLMQAEDLSIEEVDVLTGTAIGFPRTGTFRLADLVGIDVLAHVARNFPRADPGAAEQMALPAFLETMLERRWLGDKTGQGFYKKTKGPDGTETRLALDWKTLEYRRAEKPRFASLDMAKNTERVAERIHQLLAGDAVRDKAARFHWRLATGLWNYAAGALPEIADDVASVDRAMRAGFNWQLGPFEMWDAAGVRATVERAKAAGEPVSAAAERLLAAGGESWYRDHGRECFDPASARWRKVETAPGVARIADARTARGVVRSNPGASLVDLGGGVACIEMHSPKNAVGEDIVRMVSETLAPDGDGVRQFAAFVLASDAGNFSVGANLMQLLLSMQEEEWDEIDRAIRAFQQMTALIRYCPRPVVVAPFGLCLGGGAEMALHAARRQAHAELYMGLVETGVGLLPAGGGSKEMTVAAIERAAAVRDSGRGDSVELIDALRRAFETCVMAKASTSAEEARGYGFLSAGDGITMNRERLLADAQRQAGALAAAGYVPPAPRLAIPAPGENVLATLRLAVRMMREGEYISDHDVTVANHLAYVMSGGAVTPGTPVSEQYLLDLEREAFLSLCGEKKTQERIAHTLKTGKPLRN